MGLGTKNCFYYQLTAQIAHFIKDRITFYGLIYDMFYFIISKYFATLLLAQINCSAILDFFKKNKSIYSIYITHIENNSSIMYRPLCRIFKWRKLPPRI